MVISTDAVEDGDEISRGARRCEPGEPDEVSEQHGALAVTDLERGLLTALELCHGRGRQSHTVHGTNHRVVGDLKPLVAGAELVGAGEGKRALSANIQVAVTGCDQVTRED